MKKFLLFILALSAIYSALAADESHPTLVVPKTSGLVVKTVEQAPLSDVSFSGEVWVSGLLIAQWPADIKTLDPHDKITVSIKLDKTELSHLPYFDWPEWKKSYIPQEVYIWHPEDAVKLVFSKQISSQLLNKEIQRAKVHARFQLTDYEIGVECDWPWAHATLVSADVTAVAQIGKMIDFEGC